MGNVDPVQSIDPDVVRITDSSGGTESSTGTIAETACRQTLTFNVALADITGAGDVVTTFTPGFAGTIEAIDFIVGTPVTTAAKAASLNVEIGTTNTTGGVVALTSANCTPLGAEVAGSAITAANTFTATDTISVEAASVTAFAEGSGTIIITLSNDDLRNALATIAARINAVIGE